MSPLDNMKVLFKVMSDSPVMYSSTLVKQPAAKQVSSNSLVKIFNNLKEKGIKICSRHLQ